MLSNIELKCPLSEDNNSGAKVDLNCKVKSDAFSDSSNPSPKHKSDANVNAIKNEVLQLARMRNACSQSQFSVISSQLKPDLYRIAFDDPAIDDLSDDGNGQFENCISTENEVIIDEELIASVDFFGKIIDDENVDLLSSSTGLLSYDNQHIYVNQLSLADEFAIAESSEHSFPSNKKSESFLKVNKIVDQKQNENNGIKDVFELTEDHDKDCDLVQTHQHLSTAITNDLSVNRSQRSHCNNSSELQTIKRANAVSLHRLIVNSKNVMQDIPENSIASIRDCVCCSIM